MLSGETAETGDGGSLHALLQGTRTGAAIALVKVYDDGHQTPIAYTGSANDDSSEIIGRLSTAGPWSGTFIMIRRPDASAQIDVRIAENVGEQTITRLNTSHQCASRMPSYACNNNNENYQRQTI